MKRQPITARFWIYCNEGPVRITLTEDRPILSRYCRWQHEEGWSSEYERWELDGRFVVREYETDGTDCDGRLTRGESSACHIDDLNGGREMDGVFYPRWEFEDSRQRDYYAEAAGY